MNITKNTRLFNKVYQDIKAIENINDLKKRNISLYDYNCIYDIAVILSDMKSSAQTINKNVADYFKKYGFNITIVGVGFLISF